MKLVELLAKELSEWPEDAVLVMQDNDFDKTIWSLSVEAKDLVFTNEWRSSHMFDIAICRPSGLAHDYKSAIVTRAQWQAERDRQKGGEWKRHRGGRCPVKAGTEVSTKHRDGKVVDVHNHTAQQTSSEAALNSIWTHTGDQHDIMQYRVISQPQAEEVDVKDTTIGTLSYKVEIDTSAATQAIDDLAAKWDQVDGPLLWRDTVTELNAYIEKFTREREALIERLASEGFALIPPVVSVVSEFSGVDMSD